MSQQPSMNNMLNAAGNRLSNDTMSFDEASCVNAVPHDVQRFSGRSMGDSSSKMNPQNQAIDDRMMVEERWPSSGNMHSVVGPRSEERGFEANDIHFPGRASMGNNGNRSRHGQLLFQGSSSNTDLPNLNCSGGYVGDISINRQGNGTVSGLTSRSLPGVSSNEAGPSGSSGFMEEETDSSPGSTLGGWGLSCKRKALEGSSGHSFQGGSSSSFPHAEYGAWNTCTNQNPSSSLSLSPPSWNPPSVNPPEQSNTRVGLDVRGAASGAFPSSNFTANSDHLRNIGRRVNTSHQQESVPYNLPTPGGPRHSGLWSMHQSSRPALLSDSLDFRPMPAANSSASPGPSHPMHASTSSRNFHHFPWNSSSTSRAGNSSSSYILGERGPPLPEEVSLRNVPRNSGEHSAFIPIPEIRNTGQDPAGWSLATGNMGTTVSVSSTRVSPSSSFRSLPTPSWIPHQNLPPHNRPRFSEFSPWSLFPSIDPESVSGHFPSSSRPSASSQETGMSSASSSQGHNQSGSRSGFFMDGQSDDVLGMSRSLRGAVLGGRHQLLSEQMRQLLNAINRDENLNIEDSMLFDPFIHGMADLYDRHRDMRLDVDNMSYEELLALGERIGDVKTGLSEETILKLMKQQKYFPMTIDSIANLEPCSICQEEYMNGDDLGVLDCGHEFHTDCIKQWLVLKNLCPICKMTALPT